MPDRPITAALLDEMTDAVRRAGSALLERYDPTARPRSRDELMAALAANEAASAPILAASLDDVDPGALLLADGELPPEHGRAWALDAVEGNVNHVHGLPDWGVTATLIEERRAQATVVFEPLADRTWTARRGHGSHLDGTTLRVSAKADLSIAVALTGQAEAGQTTTYERIGASVSGLLSKALLVGAMVPATFPLLRVAAGQADVFWQLDPTVEGVAPGALLVQEAGGAVSDLRGGDWQLGDGDVLVTTPALQRAAIDALAVIA